MGEALERWANPSSPHADGRNAKRALEDARERIKTALGWNGDLIFTGSASEAAALAFARSRLTGPKPALAAVEHDAIRRQVPANDGFTLPIKSDGSVDPEGLATWLRLAPGGLIAVQHVNSETGVVQPIRELIEAVDAAGSHLLVDCAQSAGKLPLPPGDLLIVSPHKFGGPPGAAALLVRDLKLLVPAGGQERGYRGGTENLPAIMGMVAALESLARDGGALERQLRNRAILDEWLEVQGGTVICRDSVRSPYVASYAMPHMSAQAQLVRLDGMGFSVSAGSACSSGSMKPSHVLEAIGIAPDVAARVVRVSFAPETQDEEVLAFARAWQSLAAEAASRAA
jgi:cysteine desulfurase